MKNIAKGFTLAINMLTTLPFFKVHDFFTGINGFAVMFYPLVGFILGSILYGISLVLEPYIPNAHLHVILFALWVVLTGALHLDGLSDAIDALFVSKDRAVEVMKDPHVGAMGMTYTGVFLILKASALITIDALYLLPLILMLSRFNVVLAIYFLPYIRENGMSTLAKKEFIRPQLIVSIILVFATSLFFNQGLILLALALVSLFLFKLWFTKRFGGFSGDLYGFMIEGTELILLHGVIVLC
ncbi:adenosylcobinamide-GDP ribazoletransferase [Sulfurimonas sp. MAG313]|nr:adenosylcobinamide-GDP ribazoletransferase [Sulfurimonas sp. MAG313]